MLLEDEGAFFLSTSVEMLDGLLLLPDSQQNLPLLAVELSQLPRHLGNPLLHPGQSPPQFILLLHANPTTHILQKSMQFDPNENHLRRGQFVRACWT